MTTSINYVIQVVSKIQSTISSSPLHSVSKNRGRLPSMLQSIDVSTISAQDATLEVKPSFSISNGETGGASDDSSTNNDPIFTNILQPQLFLFFRSVLSRPRVCLCEYVFALCVKMVKVVFTLD